VIRQRQMLIDHGKSKANKMHMLRIIDKLQRQLNYYSYASDKKAAKFFLRFQDEIWQLLPGEGSGSQGSREREFESYLLQTKKIVENENLHRRKVYRTGLQQSLFAFRES
jgi:hypothetical protein